MVFDPVVTIKWEAVTRSHPDDGFLRPIRDVVINNYEVVLELEDSTFSATLPPEETSLTVPDGFIPPGVQVKFEILAREVSYNQTAVESCFIVN